MYPPLSAQPSGLQASVTYRSRSGEVVLSRLLSDGMANQASAVFGAYQSKHRPGLLRPCTITTGAVKAPGLDRTNYCRCLQCSKRERMNTDPSSSSSSSSRFPERQSLPGSAERNTPAIVDALLPHLIHLAADRKGKRTPVRVLELASGTGTHVAAFAKQASIAGVVFQPTEADEWMCAQILKKVSSADGKDTILPPLILDLNQTRDWDAVKNAQDASDNSGFIFDAVFAFNLLHITPFEVTHSIFQQLDPKLSQSQSLPTLDQSHGFIAFYGAFKEHENDELSEGNAKFDADVRSRNPSFGIRSVDAIREVAKLHGYRLAERISMPANNWILIFRPSQSAISQ
ncbi:hypothetical protein CF327_g3305 [Tilletia walkeri]|uniref:Methyltransferase domain-containing protein n=1 Tax=Tilletia walkeri TaxID=117179 RepID=A0A8X7N5N4_9BASI|nr:hypothetical protein CF327_g3305 [Tilletia walkeri]KAE8266100.1 hypothetical protein A4X09_0g6246 [Tilletia walkeri]